MNNKAVIVAIHSFSLFPFVSLPLHLITCSLTFSILYPPIIQQHTHTHELMIIILIVCALVLVLHFFVQSLFPSPLKSVNKGLMHAHCLVFQTIHIGLYSLFYTTITRTGPQLEVTKFGGGICMYPLLSPLI